MRYADSKVPLCWDPAICIVQSSHTFELRNDLSLEVLGTLTNVIFLLAELLIFSSYSMLSKSTSSANRDCIVFFVFGSAGSNSPPTFPRARLRHGHLSDTQLSSSEQLLVLPRLISASCCQ